MTNKEFYDYLATFNKSTGCYTKDEVYEIGKAYRDVVGKKCWDDLSLELGWSSGENLRTFIKNRLAKEGKLQSRLAPTVEIAEMIDSGAPTSEVENELDAKLQQLYKEQTKYRDIMNSYRRSMREDARLEALRSEMREAMKDLPLLPTIAPTISRVVNVKSEAVLLLSDLHIGVECSNFYNTYNSDVAAQRLNILLDNTIKYCKTHNVARLNIINLGDCIHGLIHTSARIEQEMDIISQVMTASELISKFLNAIQYAAPEVIYRSCTDNHSRTMANKHEALEEENLFRLIDWYLMERLKGSNIIFKQDNIDISLGKFTLLNGKKLMFAHGHLENLNQLVQSWVGATQEYIDYLCVGHFHCEKIKTFQNAKVIVNGSIVGTEQYALSKRLFSKPSQYLLLFEGNNFISMSIGLGGNE